jgi:Raf kinase inhibitor-like YbhB/YbcL family protein
LLNAFPYRLFSSNFAVIIKHSEAIFHMNVRPASFSRSAFMVVILELIAASLASGGTLTLNSRSFADQQSIPARYTCAGRNESPALSWSGVPKETRSLVLMVDDPDAPMGTFVHWLVYNISPTTEDLPANVLPSTPLNGGEQGINGRGETGYAGPCPPPGTPHHYHFRLYAVDQRLGLQPGANAAQVQSALKEHVLATTELIGIFGR